MLANLLWIVLNSVHGGHLDQLRFLNHLCALWKQDQISFILELQHSEDIVVPELEECWNRPILMLSPLKEETYPEELSNSVDILAPVDVHEFVQLKIHDGSLNGGIWILPKHFLGTNNIKTLKLNSLVYVYWKSGDHIVLEEVYSVMSKKLVINSLGTFDPVSDQLNMSPIKPLWERRSNLTGITLRTTVLQWLPHMGLEMATDGKVKSMWGANFDALRVLQNKMGFDYTVEVPPDGNFGVQDDKGIWNGVVGQGHRKEVDMIIAPLSLNLERSQVIDYLNPITISKSQLVLKKQVGSAFNIWGFIVIFTVRSWIYIMALSLLMAVYFFFRRKVLDETMHQALDSEEWGFSNSVGLVVVTLIQLQYPVFIKRSSLKIIYLSVCLFSYLVFEFYTADLTSRLTVIPPEVSIGTLSQALNLGYKIVVEDNTVLEIVLSTAPEGTSFHTAWNDVILPNPELQAKGFEAAEKLVLEKEKHAFFTTFVTYAEDPR